MKWHKYAHPGIMWFVVFAGILVSFLAFPDEALLPRTTLSWITFAIAAAGFFVLSPASLRVHKQAPQSVEALHYIVTNGAYAYVRHPMYIGDILLGWGLFFLFPTTQVLAAIIWLTAILILWMHIEEWALLQKFGIEYTKYKKSVPMIFPRLRK